MAMTLVQIYIPMIATLGASAVAVFDNFYVGRGMRSQEWMLSLVREMLLPAAALRQVHCRIGSQSPALLGGMDLHVENVMPLLALDPDV